MVTSGTATDASFVLEQRCHGSAIVRVVDEVTGAPVKDARVGVNSLLHFTDEYGYVRVIDTVDLPPSTSNTVSVTVNPPVGVQGFTKSVSLGISRCGGTGVTVVTMKLPVPDFARARITVVDADTDLPIQGASVNPTNKQTNAAGIVDYTRTLGFDGAVTQFPVTFRASASGYFTARATDRDHAQGRNRGTAVRAGPSQDGIRRGHGAQPPDGGADPGASVGSAQADANGHYRIDGLALDTNNTPAVHNISASADDYWGAFALVTVQPTRWWCTTSSCCRNVKVP